MTPIEQIIEKFDEQSIHDVECAIWDKNFNVCDCGIARASNFLEKALSSLQESTESREKDCYCVCHSPVSSRPICEHCERIQEFARFHEGRRVREELRAAVENIPIQRFPTSVPIPATALEMKTAVLAILQDPKKQ